MHYEWHHPELGNAVALRLPPASVFIRGRPSFGLNFLAGKSGQDCVEKTSCSEGVQCSRCEDQMGLFSRGLPYGKRSNEFH